MSEAHAALLTDGHCHRMIAWGDVCVYKSMCWDGTKFIMFKRDALSDINTAWLQENLDDLVSLSAKVLRLAEWR